MPYNYVPSDSDAVQIQYQPKDVRLYRNVVQSHTLEFHCIEINRMFLFKKTSFRSETWIHISLACVCATVLLSPKKKSHSKFASFIVFTVSNNRWPQMSNTSFTIWRTRIFIAAKTSLYIDFIVKI